MTFPIQSPTANLPTSSKSHQIAQIYRHPTYRHEPTTDYPQYKPLRFKRHEKLEFHSAGLWRIHEGFIRTLAWGSEGENARARAKD